VTSLDIYDRVIGGPTPGEVTVPEEHRQTSYDWHDGQSSPLYSMASTGTIASRTHQEALLREVRADLKWVREVGMPRNPDEYRGEEARLQALLDFIEGAFPHEAIQP
jgi:hypothetical protein